MGKSFLRPCKHHFSPALLPPFASNLLILGNLVHRCGVAPVSERTGIGANCENVELLSASFDGSTGLGRVGRMICG